MNSIRAFAVVCSLLVLAGGSVSFALGGGFSDESGVEANRGLDRPVDVQIMPDKNRILRDQPMNFAVRVVSDGDHGILLGLRVHSETSATFEFHNPHVERLSVPLLYPDFDTLAYIPAEHVDTEEYVPVTVSPNEKFPASSSTVEVAYVSRKSPAPPIAEFTFGIRCPIECHAELMMQWVVQNIELLVGILGLLIAFFGRKRIWDFLRLPREDDTGGEPPEADAVGEGQPPDE